MIKIIAGEFFAFAGSHRKRRGLQKIIIRHMVEGN